MEDCWYFAGQVRPDGYGQLWITGQLGRKKVYSHRLFYELYKGKIPKGLVIDHICENKICVNPDHLEAVTQRENLMRGATLLVIESAKTHCAKGHSYNYENTYYRKTGKRGCRICARQSMKALYDLRKVQI